MKQRGAGRIDLTGVWDGLYTYPHISKSVAFVATLIETQSALTGSTHEPRVFRDGSGATLYATLAGTRQNGMVTFRKTYEAAGPNYDTVDYEGTLNADGTEIAGRWIIRRAWSGTFLMIRSAGKAETVTRKAVEKV
jgi:hypothetical protein